MVHGAQSGEHGRGPSPQRSPVVQPGGQVQVLPASVSGSQRAWIERPVETRPRQTGQTGQAAARASASSLARASALAETGRGVNP